MRILIAAALSLAVAAPATAQLYLGHGDVVAERQPSDSDTREFGFGRAMVRIDDQLVVGAAGFDMGLDGEVIAYRRTSGSWVEFQRIDQEAPLYDALGYAMVWTGGHLVVGAPASPAADGTPGVGAVHSFLFDPDADAWTPAAVLENPGPTTDALFGSAIAFAADTLFVAAPHTALTSPWSSSPRIGQNGGRVYAYRRDPGTGAWTLVDTLQGTRDQPGDGFGLTIAASGSHLVIGAPGEEGRGVVYLYELTSTGVTFVSRIENEAGAPAHNFGRSLSIAGDRLVVGAAAYAVSVAPGPGVPGNVFVFDLTPDGPAPVATLSDDHPLFGWAVLALDESALLVGAPGDGGVVLHFIEDESGAWPLVQRLAEPVQTTFRPQSFGETLYLNQAVYVGAPAALHDMGTLPSFSKGGNLYELSLASAPPVDLVVTVAAPSEAQADTVVPITFTVAGDDSGDTQLAYLDFRAEMERVFVPVGCFTLRSAVIRCELGAIEAGSSKVLEFSVQTPMSPPLTSSAFWAYAGSELPDPDTSDNLVFDDIGIAEPPAPLPSSGGGALGWLTVLFLLAMLKSRIRLRRSAPCSARTCGLRISTPSSR